MDHQRQTQQTENLIKEMLEFLDSTSEEEDDPGKLTANEIHVDTAERNNKTTNGEELMKALTESKKDKKSNSTIAKELKKQYPIWNTKEIVSNNKKASNSSQSLAAIAKPIWRQSSLSLLAKSDEPAEGDVLTTNSEIDNNDWHTKLETNCRRSSSNAYIQEVQKAIYGDTTDHPSIDSSDYYQAAQNYAVYGKNFLDFPENLQSVLNDKSTCSTDNSNSFANGLYPVAHGQGILGVNGGGGFNNFVIPNTTTSNTVATTSTAAPAVPSTAAYYQICNGMQPQTRQTVGNAQAYGIFLGNKVTYVAATPAAPSIVYNQHTTSTTNFISNSLANAALASSPAILYSNPVLTTTTQQCLNTFFKETQLLCNGAAANSAQGTAVGANSTGIYERLVYAQMLQQQMYYQTQQAAAVAAMFQHKQRVTAAAAAAASARQATNGVNANAIPNGNTTISPPVTSMATTCNSTTPKACSRHSGKACKNSTQCCRQAASAGNTSPTELSETKQPIVTNSTVTTDDVSNALKD